MRRTATPLAAILLGLAALAPVLTGDPFLYHLGILIDIQALLALSLHLMLRIGQLSLAQAGFMGIGAYASALLVRDAGWPFLTGFAVAGLLPAAIAFVAGRVLLKVRGIYFVLLTFALGEAITLVFAEWVVPFGGNSGLTRIPAASLAGWSLKPRPLFYLFASLVLAAAAALTQRLFSRETGLVLRGIAGNEPLLESLGIEGADYRRLVFVISAAVAGLSGGLYAHYLGFISPAAFNVAATVNVLVMNVVGGAGLMLGPILGAAILVPIPELFRAAATYQLLLYGSTLLALMLVLPRGILGRRSEKAA